MNAVSRQRVRRALQRLELTPAQVASAARRLREEARLLQAAREELVACRRQLRQALGPERPDSVAVLELTVQERVLERAERELGARLEGALVAVLRPEQALRLRALSPEALSDLVGRLSA